jgi:hypothetical protein
MNGGTMSKKTRAVMIIALILGVLGGAYAIVTANNAAMLAGSADTPSGFFH